MADEKSCKTCAHRCGSDSDYWQCAQLNIRCYAAIKLCNPAVLKYFEPRRSVLHRLYRWLVGGVNAKTLDDICKESADAALAKAGKQKKATV